MPTILRAYRQSSSGALELKLELNLVSNQARENPANAPLVGFDRIVLFDVNKSGAPLLILDVLPQNEDGSEQVSVSSNRKEIRLNCLLRCLLRKTGAKPVLRFDCALKIKSNGQIVFDSLEMVGPPGLAPFPEVRGQLENIENEPLESLRNKTLTIERVGEFPDLARRLGLTSDGPPEQPNDDPKDPRSKIRVTFACLEESGLPSTTNTIHLVFSRRMSIQQGVDHKVLSPAPDVRVSRCSPDNEWQEDARLNICKNQIEALKLHDGNLAPLAIVQRQPRNRKTQEYNLLPLGQWVVQLDGIPHTSALQLWNNSIARPYLHALHMIQDGRPVSFMPAWVFTPQEDLVQDPPLAERENLPKDSPQDPPLVAPRWTLMAKMTDGSRDLFFDDNKFDSHSDKFRAGGIGIRMRSVYPNLIEFAAKAVLPGFLSQVGEPLRLTCRVTSTQFKNSRPDELQIEKEALPFTFVTEHLPGNADEQISRVGALDLVFPDRPAKQPRIPDLQLAADSLLRVCFRKAALGDLYSAEVLTVNIKGRLALFDLIPGGQDDLPGEEFVSSDAQGSCDTATLTDDEKFEAGLEQQFRRRRPLLIPFPTNLANALLKSIASQSLEQTRLPQFILDFEERTEAEQSQTLSMRLLEYGEGSSQLRGQQRLIALDTQPFLVALVEAPPFVGSGPEGIREIGNWSATADEGASWELIGSSEGFNLFLPPQGLGEAMEKWKLSGKYEDVPENKPIDFRFSPLAKLNLKPSPFKQRFAEAPWNLRRILGFPGQRAPGANIVNARFELFYGLACQVTYPFLRLAELDSKLGQIPGRLSRDLKWKATASKQQLEVYRAFRSAWAELYSRYLSRLSVLEAYDANQPTNLIVTDGVTYELRNTAKLRYPISTKLVPENDIRRKSSPEDGLAGGVTWGFESANIYDQLLSEPKSFVGSQLANPFFSSLGGWGNQKAVFNGGLTTIYANVAMGRTYFYSIERIGRIGAFWNLAKHVIIYERTVAPTEQFKDKQEHHLGRPLLRKVREFVELLQPIRKYPEFGAEAISRGFVTGDEFKSRVINVDSDWGNDIPNEGWQVPLWNVQASKDKPNVYPKPQILLEVAADGEGGGVINVELQEPEKLVFFTRTVDDSEGKNGVKAEDRANTDKWPAVRNIDFPDQPAPVKPSIPAYDAASLDRPLPDAQTIEPGYEQFTFAVAPASRQINLMAERTSEVLNVALRNVTMVRARVRDLSEFAEGAQQAGVIAARDGVAKLKRITEQTEEILQTILSKLPKDGNVTQAAVTELGKTIDELIAKHKSSGGLTENFNALIGQTVGSKKLSDLFRGQDVICGLLNKATDAAIDQAAERVGKVFVEVETDLHKAIDDLSHAIGTDDLKARVIDGVKEYNRRIEELFTVINTGLEELMRQVETGYQAALDFKTQAEREINAVISIADKLTTEGSARARQEIEELRRTLQALLRKLESASRSGTQTKLAGLIEKVRANLVTLGKKIDDGLGAIDKKIEQGATNVKTEMVAFKNDLTSAFTQLETDLTTLRGEIQTALMNAQTEANKPRKVIIELQTKLIDGINQVQATPAALNQAVSAVMSQAKTDFDQAVGDAKAKVREITCNVLVAKLLDEAGEFGTALKNLFGGGAAADHFLEKLKAQLNAAIGKSFAELRGDIERAFDEVRFRLAPFADRVNQALGELAGLVDETLHQIGDTTLRLLRAFGDAPRVPMLDFNRLRLAYYFDELKKHVDLTPVTALFNRLGDDLKGFGLRFPVANLLDRVVPDALENFDLSNLFPDFAGLKLEKLFSGLKFPLLPKLPGIGNGENVKVTHGVDTQARRAWVKAVINVPLTDKATIFSFGPVELKLANAKFTADAMITAELGSAPRLKVQGQIKGDWELIILGTSLVTFRETTLTFDDQGKIRFDISTDKIEMAGALQFLTDLLKRFLPSDDSLPPIRLIIIDGKPAGVEAVIDLPLPPVQLGAFGISGLVMGAGFRLLLRPVSTGIEFALGVALSFGKKEDPFTLTIFILGGGGWFDTRLTYYPLNNRLLGDITIGITASASLAIALGPIKGSVSITFGIYADFHIDTGGGTAFAITLMLLLKGEVEVLGIVSVSISLLLEAQYSSDGSLVGRGTLKVRIKICWCFTFKFSKTVTYTFKQGSGSGSQAAIASSFGLEMLAAGDEFDLAAAEYLEMFE